MGVPRSCVRACKGKCNWPCSCFYRAVNCRVALCICKSNIKMHIPVQKVSDLIKIQIFKTLQRLNFNLTEYNKGCMFLYGRLSFYFHQRDLDLEFFDANLKYIFVLTFGVSIFLHYFSLYSDTIQILVYLCYNFIGNTFMIC